MRWQEVELHYEPTSHHNTLLDKSRAQRSVNKSFDDVFLAQFSRLIRYAQGVQS